MRAWELRQYERRLYDRTPLIGFLRRRRAAQALAEDGSMAAMRTLAEAVTRHEDPRVRTIARQALHRLEDWRGISAACEVWAETRHPELTALLLEKEWVASTPPAVKTLTALKQGRLGEVNGADERFVGPLLAACEDADPTIATRARRVLEELVASETRDALCRYVIEHDRAEQPLAWEIVLQAGYEPRDEQLRALFLFVTEQWARYDALDFDRRLLRTAYAVAEPLLRRRIREKLRTSGRADFLTAIAGDDYVARVAEMTAAELDLLIRTLYQHRDWARLWPLAQEVPFAWSAGIVLTLAREGWAPDAAEERDLLETLTAILHAGGQEVPAAMPRLEDEALKRFLPPPALLRARARVPGRINDVAFSPTRPLIAVGTGQRKVVTWNYQRARREHVLGPFAHSIGHVIYTGDGTLLWGERTNTTDVPCALYRWNEARAGEPPGALGQHVGSVTALAPAGPGRALSAGRDQQVVLWDVESGREVARRRTYYWPRAARVSPDGQRVALLRQGLELLELPSLEYLRFGSGSSVGRSVAFLPPSGGDGSSAPRHTLLMGRYNGEVSVYHDRTSYWIARRIEPFTRHAGRVEGVEVLPHRSIAVTAGSEGIVRFTAIPTGVPAEEIAGDQVIGEVEVPLGCVTSLRVSRDGKFMAVGNSEAALSLWDLRALDARQVLLQPFARGTALNLSALNVLLQNEELPPRTRTALQFADRLLRHRARFDIEIDDTPMMMPGEFDIEVEG
jgi:hypothetical protein